MTTNWMQTRCIKFRAKSLRYSAAVPHDGARISGAGYLQHPALAAYVNQAGDGA